MRTALDRQRFDQTDENAEGSHCPGLPGLRELHLSQLREIPSLRALCVCGLCTGKLVANGTSDPMSF